MSSVDNPSLPVGLVTEEVAIRLAAQWLHPSETTQKHSDFGDKKYGGTLVSLFLNPPCKEENIMENNSTSNAVSSNAPVADQVASPLPEMENNLLSSITALTNNVGHAVGVQAELLAEMKSQKKTIKSVAIDTALMVTAVGLGVAGGLALFEYGIKPLTKSAV